MGKVETYDQTLQNKWTNGLLGYAHGQQSIFLDAETGNATFGLNSDDETDTNNPQAAGRIELRPGGTSRISRWKFDKTSLYNANFEEKEVEVSANTRYIDAPGTKGNLAPHSIPHWAQGIMLNADPSYISIKGKRLTSQNTEIDFDGANTVIYEGDTFEGTGFFSLMSIKCLVTSFCSGY